MAAYYPPLMINDGPTAPGIAIEIVRMAATRAGRQFVVEFAPIQRALHISQTERGTLLASVLRNEHREAQFQWIAQLDSTRTRFMSIGQPVDTLDDARSQHVIGVEKGTSQDLFLTSAGFTNLLRLGSAESSAQMLRSGRIDAWFLDGTSALRIWNRLDLGNDLVMGGVIHESPIYLAGHLDFPVEAARQYRAAIASMYADGSIARILAKYE